MFEDPNMFVFGILGIIIGMFLSTAFNMFSRTSEEETEEDDDIGIDDYRTDNPKMVFVVRTDLKMGKGKIAA